MIAEKDFSLVVSFVGLLSSVCRVVPAVCLLLSGLFISLQAAAAESVPLEKISAGWFYHWGDLPRDEVSETWQFESVKWQASDTPWGIAERQENHILWLKARLPEGDWRDPNLFISSADLNFQTFLASELIYQFGDIDEAGVGTFKGWPWHLIRLPDGYAQEAVYFRIYSDYADIGLSGEVVIGERFELLDRVYQRGFVGLVFILVLLTIGIVSSLIGVIKRDGLVAVPLGLLSLDLAVMMFAENELSQLFLFSPLCWRYIAAFSYFLVPALLAVVVQSWIGGKSTLCRAVLAVSLLFIASVALLSLTSLFSFVDAYPYFDVLFIVLVLALMIRCLLKPPWQGAQELLMILGIFALFSSLVIDMMSAHGYIDWIGRMGQWGLAFFALASLGIYLLKDYRQQKQLTQLTHHLETEVEIRTRELKASQKQLEQLAREDFLTSLLNRRAFSEQATVEISQAVRQRRPLSLLLFDLDHFKEINDCYGHSTGDRVLKAIAEVTRDTCREGDLVCRYGGEEFVVLLHATGSQYAKPLGNRLREAINHIVVDSDEGQALKVTASFGLVCVDDFGDTKQSAGVLLDRLLSEADHVMYQVKTAGRDAIKTYVLEENELSQERLAATNQTS